MASKVAKPIVGWKLTVEVERRIVVVEGREHCCVVGRKRGNPEAFYTPPAPLRSLLIVMPDSAFGDDGVILIMLLCSAANVPTERVDFVKRIYAKQAP